MDKLDVAIIGCGMSGLAAGIRLAHFGKRVCIFERHNAPGGLKKSKGGYHAWQSRDMVNWVHHGPITEGFSKWMTSAEYVDGKAYFYYDFPNDQDPHLYIDEDLTKSPFQ